MKIFYWTAGIITTALVGIFILLFTSFGNDFLKPTIEKEIQKRTQLDSKLKTFRLSLHDCELLLELSSKNTIALDGVYSIWNRSLDMTYMVDLNDVKSLKELFTQEIDTPLHVNGTAKGDSKLLIVKGRSDISSSETAFEVSLVEFQAKNINLNIKSLKIKEALVILQQPPYSAGKLDVVVKISDLREGKLKGTIDTKISQGLLNAKYISKTYEFKSTMPRTTYNLSTHSILEKNIVNTSVDLNSNLANLDVKKFYFDTDNLSFMSDYKVNIHNLDKLYFISQRHLLGSLKAYGNVKKFEDFDLSVKSNVAGGKLIATLHNNDLDAKVNDMRSRDILRILKYPQIFDAKLNGLLDYNLATQKGLFKGKLSKGRFSQNQSFDLLKRYAQTDIYREKFKGNVDAKIDRDDIVASIALNSKNSSITSKGAKINSQKNLIDSNIRIDSNSNHVDVTLKGDINKPDVTISADELLKKEGTKVIKKELGKFLKGFF